MSDPTSTSDIQNRVAQTRAQLESTLDQIEDRLNVPKQVGSLFARIRSNYEANPTPWIAGVATGVAVIGAIVAVAVTNRD